MIMLVVAIQVLILGLVGLFLFRRRFDRFSKSESRTKPFLVQHARQISIFGGTLMGVVLVVISIYYIGTFDRSDRHKPTSPISKHSSSLPPEPIPYEKEDPFEQPSPEKAKSLMDSETNYGDSRIQEITRKAIRGKLPDFPKKKHPPNPVLHSYLRIIDGWLEDKDSLMGQAHDTKWVYQRLVKEYGFMGSSSTVKNLLKQRNTDETSGSAPLFLADSSCGREAVVNLSKVNMVFSETEVTLYLFSMQSRWSTQCFVRCCVDAQLNAFIDAHIRAFEFFGGIFPSIVYVNLPGTMERGLSNTHGPEHHRFSRFCTYYNISPKLPEPNPGKKNRATNECRDILHRERVSDSAAGTLEELNRTLLAECLAFGEKFRKGHSRAINDLFKQEKICLLAFPKTPHPQ